MVKSPLAPLSAAGFFLGPPYSFLLPWSDPSLLWCQHLEKIVLKFEFMACAIWPIKSAMLNFNYTQN